MKFDRNKPRTAQIPLDKVQTKQLQMWIARNVSSAKSHRKQAMQMIKDTQPWKEELKRRGELE